MSTEKQQDIEKTDAGSVRVNALVRPPVAISIRQPWAWLILHAGKDIENRNWQTPFRGDVYIHASKGMTRDEYEMAYDFVMCQVDNKICMPAFESLERGGIVGIAEIVDCVQSSDSPWFVGEYGFVLKNVIPVTFRPYKGALGFFKVD